MTVDVAEVLEPVLQRTLSSFEAAGVRWVVLRGRDRLANPEHDVDLLVAASDLVVAETIIFAHGGIPLPRRVHPWHRMYLLDSTTHRLLLDVVTTVVLHRDLRLPTGLEDTVLERCRWDGTARVMDPSDLFWTVLLHCLFDKQDFSPRRCAELTSALSCLVPGGPGERCYTRLSGGVPSAAELVSLVRRQDWLSLVAVADELVRRCDPRPERSDPPRAAVPARPRSAATAAARARTRRLLVLAYPHLARRVGLSAVPRAPHAAEAAGVPVRIEDVERRPLVCTSVLRARDEHLGPLASALRDDGFVALGGGHYRFVATGVECALVRPCERDRDIGLGDAVTDIRTTGTIPDEAPLRRPLVVSFSGLDGAGKTRQIEGLLAALAPERRVELRWVPFKIWPAGVLGGLPAGFRSRLGPRRTDDPPAAPQPADARTSGAHSRGGLWWCIGTLASVSGALSLRRRAARPSTDVLVLDRYRLDTAVKLLFWYPDVSPRWLSHIVFLLAPAPDVEFLLRVAPEVAHARKPEQWSVEQLTRQARLYDDLTDGRNVVVLDAEDDPDRIAGVVQAHVRRVLDDR